MAKKRVNPAPQGREEANIKSFLDMIAPSVVSFMPDHFICGNTYRCVWALREYPTSTDEQAILRHLGEKDGITLRIYTRQVTPAEEKRIIQNAANKNRMNSSNTNDLHRRSPPRATCRMWRPWWPPCTATVSRCSTVRSISS